MAGKSQLQFFNREVIILLVATFTLSAVQLANGLTVECVDTWDEFKANGWRNLLGTGLEYAETSDDLPGELKGNLDGQGLIYTDGLGIEGEWGGYSEGITNPYYRRNFSSPIFLYVRWFGLSHNTQIQSQVRVSPAEHPDVSQSKYIGLPSNGSNFDWQESLVQIEYYIYGDIFVGMSDMYENDYFVVDRLILTHSGDISGIEEIKSHCGWTEGSTVTTSQQTSTTTTSTTTSGTTTTTTTTTERPTTPTPVPPFRCQEEGSFADPSNCDQFHVCTANELGDLTDNVLTCPDRTVWCQREQSCQFPDVCPCSN